MSSNTEVLEPCPFCGSKNIESKGDGDGLFWERCLQCFATGPEINHRGDDEPDWNTRYTPPRTDWPKMGGGESFWRAAAIDRAPEGLYYIFEGVIGCMMPGGPERLTDDRKAWIKNGRERCAIGPLGLNAEIVRAVTGERFRQPEPRTYDGDVAALAPMLLDGWVAMDENGRFDYYSTKPEIFKDGYFGVRKNGGRCYATNFQITACSDWRSSLRRIQGGKVLPV